MKNFLWSFLGSLLALIVLLALIGGAVLIKLNQQPKIEDGSWLVVDLYGEILEYPPPAGPLGAVTGGEPETLHRILDNLEKARHDERIEGVIRHESEIDVNIRKYAPAWPVDQISVIDRNILRLAIYEILFDNKVPVKVAVSEAVELAKTFGSETSAKFVNGVLGSVSTLASR